MKIDAQARERWEALRDELRREAEASIPDDYAIRGMQHKYLKGDNAASGMSDAADRIDAILRQAETPELTPPQQGALDAVHLVDTFCSPNNDHDAEVLRECFTEIRRFIEQAGAGWQPISSAPKEAKEVQVYCADTREQFVAFWNGGQHWKFAQGPDGLSIVCQPTHWMPLGPPPEATDD